MTATIEVLETEVEAPASTLPEIELVATEVSGEPEEDEDEDGVESEDED